MISLFIYFLCPEAGLEEGPNHAEAPERDIAPSKPLPSTCRTPQRKHKKADSHHHKKKYDYSRSRKKTKRSPSSSHSPHNKYNSSSSSDSSEGSAFSSSVSPSTKKRRKTPHFQYRVGEKIGHKYRVTRLLGTGTFGRVMEGRYEGRYYAIKVTLGQVR